MSKQYFLAILLLVFMMGCAGAQMKTQDEMRVIQTRTYETNNVKMVMQAVVQAINDNNMVIQQANEDLGFITAKKESRLTDMANIMTGHLGWEYSITISGIKNKTRVRLKIKSLFSPQRRTMVGSGLSGGGAMDIQAEGIYQEFFSSLDQIIDLGGN